MEDGLGLTTITRLLPIVAALSLREQGVLALLVLRHLVRSVKTMRRSLIVDSTVHIRMFFACFTLAV